MKNDLDVNHIQYLISNNIALHPILQNQFEVCLLQLEHKGKMSLLPVVILNMYNKKLNYGS